MSKTKSNNEDLLETLTQFYTGQIKPDLENLKQELRGEINNARQELKTEIKGVKVVLTSEIRDVKTEVRWLKDEVKGLKGEFSKQVSRAEFNKLKSTVNRYHPAS